jgi:hypothetical protein
MTTHRPRRMRSHHVDITGIHDDGREARARSWRPEAATVVDGDSAGRVTRDDGRGDGDLDGEGTAKHVNIHLERHLQAGGSKRRP